MTRFATIQDMKWRTTTDFMLLSDGGYSDVRQLGYTEIYIAFDDRANRWYVVELDGRRCVPVPVSEPLWSVEEAQARAKQHLDKKLLRVYGIEIVDEDKPVALALDGPKAGEIIKLPKAPIGSRPWTDRLCVPHPWRLSFTPLPPGEVPKVSYSIYEHFGSIIGKLRVIP